MKDLVWQMYRQLATKGCRAFLFTTFLASTSLPAATYSSGGINLAIPDPGTINIPIVVTDTGLVSDVNLRLRLSHTFDSDLVISLIGPDNTTVILANRRGNGGHDFGAGNPDCSGTLTVFDDSASFKISLASPPFAGTYLPDQALTNFNGKAVNGTWKLRVQDIATGDQGTIHCIQLEITKSGSPPSVLTLLPANLTATRADFQASVNPGTAATSAYFQYGLDTAYGMTTAVTNLGSGSTAVIMDILFTNLLARTEYHYRAVATNSGGTVIGNDIGFVTAGAAGFTNIFRPPGGWTTLQGTGTPRVLYTIQASSNLQSWTGVTNFVSGSDGSFQFTNLPSAFLPAQYYRLFAP